MRLIKSKKSPKSNVKHLMMRNLLRNLATLLVLLAFCASAQAQSMVDVVYLKNGSIIRGMIIEQVPNESLKIKTRDGSVFVYAITDVEKITKEEDISANGTSKGRTEQAFTYVRSGFVNITTVGLGLGVGTYSGTVNYGLYDSDLRGKNTSNNYLRLETINGLWIADGIASVGLGIGLEYYMKPTSDSYSNLIPSSHGQIPIYIDFRAIPIRGKISPSFILQAGYSIGAIPAKFESNSSSGITDDKIFMNGLELAGGIGFHAEVSDNVAFNMSFLYDYQQFLYKIHKRYQIYNGYDYSVYAYDARTGALRISLGLTF